MQRSEEVAGVAVLIGVADELSVEFLVPLQGDPAGLLVVGRHQLLVGVVQLLDAFVRHPVDAIEAVLVGADGAVAVDVDGAEGAVDEELESLGEIVVGFALARGLDALLELVDGHFSILQTVSQLSY